MFCKLPVVTIKDASYKTIVTMLMYKRKHLIWTLCADLILEDFKKKIDSPSSNNRKKVGRSQFIEYKVSHWSQKWF